MFRRKNLSEERHRREHLLLKKQRNLIRLFYSMMDMTSQAEIVKETGGVSMDFLAHRDEPACLRAGKPVALWNGV
jgi:hypothetical protein